MTIYQGDNTEAFGGNFLIINISSELKELPIISRAEIRIENIIKKIENPVFPLIINLNERETSQLKKMNKIYMALYDIDGKKRTCSGSLSFEAESRRV